MVPLFRRVSVVAARAGHLLVGHGNSFEFRVLTPEGTAVEIVRLRLPGRKLTTDDVRRATRQWVEYRNPPEVWSAAREGVAKLPTPTEAPPYLRLLVDDTGAAWVSEFAQFEEPRLWWVFDASGELVSRVDMPENFKVLAVDRDRVLGVRLDEFDVEHPEVYRLSR